MYGRYTHKEQAAILLDTLKAILVHLDQKPRYNIAPSRMVACVRNAPENGHRKAVILDDKSYELWLDPEVKEPGRLTSLLQPYSSVEMEACSLSTLVNNPRFERPECVGLARETWLA